MSRFLERLADVFDNINEWVGKSVSWVNTILVVLVCADVVTRRLLGDTQTWIMELEWHLFALIFLFGAGYAFKQDKHVRVDLFFANFSKKDQAWVNAIGNIVFLIPWCVVLIYFTLQYALKSFEIRETSPDPGGLPAIYIIKFCVTIGLFFLLLQAIASTIRSVKQIKSLN